MLDDGSETGVVTAHSNFVVAGCVLIRGFGSRAESNPPGLLDALAEDRLEGAVQDEQAACPAPKLSRAEATVGFDAPAHRVRARIHGLTPWPGCDVTLGEARLRLLRVRDRPDAVEAPPGTLLEDGSIACAPGSLELLDVQPQGKKPMSFEAYRNGRSIPPGTLAESIT